LHAYCRFRRIDRLKKPAQLNKKNDLSFENRIVKVLLTHHMQIYRNVFLMNDRDKLYMARQLKFDLKKKKMTKNENQMNVFST